MRITGDIAELGTDKELKLAKVLFDSLDVPYYIIPGNHDTGWSESGGWGLLQVFGNDKFVFDHNGIGFVLCIGALCARSERWAYSAQPCNVARQCAQGYAGGYASGGFLNHYPIDSGLDNWYEVRSASRHTSWIAVL